MYVCGVMIGCVGWTMWYLNTVNQVIDLLWFWSSLLISCIFLNYYSNKDQHASILFNLPGTFPETISCVTSFYCIIHIQWILHLTLLTDGLLLTASTQSHFLQSRTVLYSYLFASLTSKICFTDIVGCWWDPLSHSQTVRLVNLVRHYAEAYPTLGPSSKPLQNLTHAIIAKIKDAIDNDIFIPMFPKK